MKIIKLSVRPVLTDIFLRQTAQAKGVWGDCRFVVNAPVDKCDWWVVCHNSALSEMETTMCDPDHVVYVSLEPEDSWLSKDFIDQFARVVLCDRRIQHPNITYKNGLAWWVGIRVGFKENGSHHYTPQFTLDYDSLSAMTGTEKTKVMSVICSTKSLWPGHKKRMKFLDKLMAHPVSKHIDFFGGGKNSVDDKWDAIAPYKYHLVMENSRVPDYWSEKLADSYLGFAYPVYYGCPNIQEYFPSDALSIIDIDKFDQAVAVLEKLIASDLYDSHFPAVINARNQVLNKYNLFQLIADICDRPAERLAQCQLKPRTAFAVAKPNTSILKRISRKIFAGHKSPPE